MTILRRNEDIEIYQVELALKRKTKQSPFISILILAQEHELISAESLRGSLLPSFPLRACENLLKRLEQQGYLLKENSNFFDYHTFEHSPYLNYTLSELGQRSATDKSFWVGEKGVYNVFLTNSNLVKQRIIGIDKVDHAEDSRNNKNVQTPFEIHQYSNKILDIEKSEVVIEGIEGSCFKLNPIQVNLEIISQVDNTVLKICEKNRCFIEIHIDLNENQLIESLLLACKEFIYDDEKKAVLTDFNIDNISLNRKIKIDNPSYERNRFNPVELSNIAHLPSDLKNANQWFYEMLYQNCMDYFYDENTFTKYINEVAEPFLLYFPIKLPSRPDLLEIFSKKQDSFYRIAKLQTIDYLHY